jgi:DNA polymerase I-like protein with 3'-5' exonuclease and polymerase domains
LGWDFDPKSIGAYRKDPTYAAARERNKRIVHGTNYGMSPRKMVELYPGSFPSERSAVEAQARYFTACVGLAEWHHRVRQQAHRQTYLVNPWGYRHYFYNVFEKGPNREWRLGSDAKRVIAFLPQSSAAAFMRDSLLILADSPWGPTAPGNVSIHDSICVVAPEAEAASAIDYLATLMTRPIPELGGLRIGAEVKVGPNWADMRTARVIHV